jgi:hypothetical protein
VNTILVLSVAVTLSFLFLPFVGEVLFRPGTTAGEWLKRVDEYTGPRHWLDEPDWRRAFGRSARRVLSLVVPLGLWAVLIAMTWFPAQCARAWAETYQRRYPFSDENLEEKGLVVMLCWIILWSRFWYRLGKSDGRTQRSSD